MLCILHRKNYFGQLSKPKKVNVTQDSIGQVFVNGKFRTNNPNNLLNVWKEHADYGQQNWFTMLVPINKHHKLHLIDDDRSGVIWRKL